jgi:putative flavoprotein involved in K+ transport
MSVGATRRVGPVRTVPCVVIGAGQSGLAMSHCLTQRSIDHVLLERGEVGQAWRRERWDSLRLLTPNWQTRLPGLAYSGDDPDGFMSAVGVADFIADYAKAISAPVHGETCVRSVRPLGNRYLVTTDRGEWLSETVVVATGAFSLPVVPKAVEALPTHVVSLASKLYRNPDRLPEGGVLVVGASATGLQLADELQRSGRPVTLAVGEHVRMPRTHRGRDIQWWMDAVGLLDERFDEIDDLSRARRVPSPQLVGSDDRADLDLNALTKRGVRIVGRLAGIRDGVACFSGSLRNVCQLADLKMKRLIAGIDDFVEARGLSGALPEAADFEPTRVDGAPRLELDLRSGEIQSVVWATGLRPDFRWLEVPCFDRKGRIRHTGGVVDAPGLYVMGLPFLRRRKSTFIHGAGDDARELCDALAAHLDRTRRPATLGRGPRPSPSTPGPSRAGRACSRVG